jgi:hypothetical protein
VASLFNAKVIARNLLKGSGKAGKQTTGGFCESKYWY